MVIAYLYAIFASFCWGAGFIGSRYGLDSFSPIAVTFLRFLTATVFLLPLLKGCKKTDFNKNTIIGSLICGALLTLMIFLQILGLQYTTIAKSGFITITYAFITPILCKIVFRENLSMVFWCSVIAAILGVFMLCDLNISSLNYGDLLTFFGAFFASIHLILISYLAKIISHLVLFNIIQMSSVCLFSAIISFFIEDRYSFATGYLFYDVRAIGGIVFMGIFSTAIAFMIQVKTQMKLKPHLAGLIFLLESPFAAILGYFIFNESLSILAIFGCIIVSLAVAIIPFEKKIILFVNNIKDRISYWLTIRRSRLISWLIP